MDSVAPTLTTASKLDATTIELTFTDGVDIDETSIEASDFSLSNGSIASVTLTENGSDADVTVSLVSAVNADTIDISIVGSIDDTNGNSLTTGGQTVSNTDVIFPTFVSPGTVSIAETTLGTLIDVNVTDDDGDAIESAVGYTITGGADNSSFTIDAETGALSFVESADFENPTDADGNNTYDVSITAASSTAETTQSLTVTIQNVDEPPAGTISLGGAQPGDRTVSVVGNTTAYVFDASGIVDPEGSGVSYTWNFVDGTTASTATVTRNYDTIVSSYLGETTVSPELTIDDGTQQTTIDNITVTFYSDIDGDGLADDDTAQGVPTDTDDDNDGILDVDDPNPSVAEVSSISGTITDADGNVITDGDVTIVRTDATHQASVPIDSDGNFNAKVPAGIYRIIIENTPLPVHELEDIEVNPTTNTRT
jgi:Cadherin domain.